jgi:hypothetical protein
VMGKTLGLALALVRFGSTTEKLLFLFRQIIQISIFFFSDFQRSFNPNPTIATYFAVGLLWSEAGRGVTAAHA